MADCYLDIEWGEQPFAFGEDSWPAPLIRPEPWPEDLEGGAYGWHCQGRCAG